MHDTLDFFRTPPTERREKYHKLTFSMMYFYSENYLLPLSHDEVVHGKATILQKMWGDLEEKFPQARAMYLYMYAHPGKKLNFMGNEFGQLREWDEKREQDWFIRKYPSHDAFYRFIRDSKPGLPLPPQPLGRGLRSPQLPLAGGPRGGKVRLTPSSGAALSTKTSSGTKTTQKRCGRTTGLTGRQRSSTFPACRSKTTA